MELGRRAKEFRRTSCLPFGKPLSFGSFSSEPACNIPSEGFMHRAVSRAGEAGIGWATRVVRETGNAKMLALLMSPTSKSMKEPER